MGMTFGRTRTIYSYFSKSSRKSLDSLRGAERRAGYYCIIYYIFAVYPMYFVVFIAIFADCSVPIG